MLKSADTLEQKFSETIQQAESSENVKQFLEANEIKVADLQEAREELRQSIEDEKNSTPEKSDKSSFFPRDAALSLAQSALQQYCEELKPEKIIQKSPEIKGGKPVEAAVADKELSPQFAQVLSGDEQGLIDPFEIADIGWANCLFAIGVRNWRGFYKFNSAPATPYKIGERARVVLFSDWGSGLPRAQKVSAEIRKELLAAKADNRDAHLIHLGDVYYSGWAKEYEKNVLPHWSVKENEADKFSSWCLNGNHDMYSGGKGFFDYLLDDARFKRQERSSVFSLENKNWLLLGLDTAYHNNRVFDPHDLYGDQNKWVHEKLSAAKAENKKGILLSHHQPFSAFGDEEGGKKITDKLRTTLDEKLVHTWFWGHEHRCALYEERENIKFPRLIGHGGIPFYVASKPLPEGVIYEYRDGFDDLNESWNYFGFVVLDFEGDTITARYINERGKQHHIETIS